MSTDVNILISAQDEASSVISGVSEEMDTSMTNVGASVESATVSLKDQALAGAQVASSAATLVMGISGVENAQVSLDRAHVTLEKSTNAVTVAQNNYNAAVKKYGADSPEATLAASKLQAAQDALVVSGERVEMAQRNLNDRMMMTVVSIVPTFISGISALSTISGVWNVLTDASVVAQYALGTALQFVADNPIILIIAAIVGVGLALYEAYEHCGPFRDAVNEIGAVLGGALKVAVTDIYNGLNWLWQNVLVPLGNFIVQYFVGYWNGLVLVFNILKTGVTDVYNAFNWLWNNILVPIGDFLKHAFTDTINGVMKVLQPLIDGINSVVNIGKTVGGTIGSALKAIGLAEGGIVYSPTLALIGESGPEAVVPLGSSNSSVFGAQGVSPLNMTALSGPSNAGSATYNISIPISIEGSVDQRTLAVLKQQLRNVVVEATSQGAPSTQKRIRVGSTF